MESTGNQLFCFCHWGGRNETSPDGSFIYKGGVTDHVYVHMGMCYEQFVTTVFGRLGIEPGEKVVHFSIKYAPNQLILLKDQAGLDTLMQLNENFAHVYVSNGSNIQVDTSTNTQNNSTMQGTRPSENGFGIDRDMSALVSYGDRLIPHASSVWNEIIVGEGQAFENAQTFRLAIYKYSIAHRFSYKFNHNRARYMSIKCVIVGCPWKISAGRDGGSESVSIKKFNNCHSHSASDLVNFKPSFNSKLMGDIVSDKIASNYSYLPNQICNDVWGDHHIKMSYHQAWASKERAKQMLDGNVEDSYKLIPWFCNRLKEVMPGTIAEWSCYDDGTFKQLFVAYACSIRGFTIGCRPVIFIDGCHLSGPYRGTLLAASALDANNGLYPIAYGVVTGENEEDWSWFLKHLKDVVSNSKVVIISDRNPAIISVVNELFGSENHAHCYRHVKENFSAYINKNPHFRLQSAAKARALKNLDEIAYARTMEKYSNALMRMKAFQPYLYDWVVSNGSEHWSNALFCKPRWDRMNSNPAESFNAWMGEDRFLPIGKLMQAHCKNYAKLLLNKVSDMSNWKIPVGNRIEKKIIENQGFGQGLVASPRPPHEVEVSERRNGNVVVNFNKGTCTCLEWQMSGIPCPHACRAIALENLNVYDCVASWYKRETQEKIYSELMSGIPTSDMPNSNDVFREAIDICSSSTSQDMTRLLPPRTKRPPGRPRKKRIESQFMSVRALRCSRCKQIGHNKSTCKEPI